MGEYNKDLNDRPSRVTFRDTNFEPVSAVTHEVLLAIASNGRCIFSVLMANEEALALKRELKDQQRVHVNINSTDQYPTDGIDHGVSVDIQIDASNKS